MSNSRRLRRGLATSQTARAALRNAKTRFPGRPPSMSTIRRRLKQGEKDGIFEHEVDTTKRGHPHMWSLTDAGKAKPVSGTFRDTLTDLQARRVHWLMKNHGISERRAIAAVTQGWMTTTAGPASRPPT